jgi:hypothetical protein
VGSFTLSVYCALALMAALQYRQNMCAHTCTHAAHEIVHIALTYTAAGTSPRWTARR